MTKKHDDDKLPEVVIPDELRAQMAADPEMNKAMMAFVEMAKNAMQGVKDGKFESFEDAMEEISGRRPEPVDYDDLPEHAQEALDAQVFTMEIGKSRDDN